MMKLEVFLRRRPLHVIRERYSTAKLLIPNQLFTVQLTLELVRSVHGRHIKKYIVPGGKIVKHLISDSDLPADELAENVERNDKVNYQVPLKVLLDSRHRIIEGIIQPFTTYQLRLYKRDKKPVQSSQVEIVGSEWQDYIIKHDGMQIKIKNTSKLLTIISS